MNHYDQLLFKSLEYQFASFAEMFIGCLSEKSYRILDIGCGNWVLVSKSAKLFPQSTLVSVDLSEPNIRLAREAYYGRRISFLAADYLQYSDQPFDLIVSYSTTNLLPIKQERLLKKIADDLKEGGLLIVSMPHDCICSRLLILFRQILRFVRCKFVDRLIFSLGRIITPEFVPDEFILQNAGYVYNLPTHMYKVDFQSAAHNVKLELIQTHVEKSSSIAKLRHQIQVFRKI